jgi:hypothetical protein
MNGGAVRFKRATLVACVCLAAGLDSSSAGAVPSGSNVNQPTSITHLASSAVIELGEKPARVALRPEGARTAFDARAQALSHARRLHLVFHGLRAEAQPETLFHVYLNLPPDAVPKDDDVRRVGTLNFFGAIRDPGAEAAGLSRSFDITDLVARLHREHLLTDDTTVTIMASRAPVAGAKASIARVAVVEQ